MIVYHVEDVDELPETVYAASQMPSPYRPVAVLITGHRFQGLAKIMAAKKKITLNRRDVVSRIIRDRGRVLIVTGLGSTTWDAAAAGDHRTTLSGAGWGRGGNGLGLARAQPGAGDRADWGRRNADGHW